MLIKVFFYNRAFNVVFKSSKNEKITLQHEFIFVFMACSGVLTLHNKCKPPKSVSPYPVLKVFNPPPVLKLFTFLLPPPPCNRKWLLLHFSHMASSKKHMFIFLKLLQLIKYCHNWFLKKVKQYIRETCFYHHTFVFFMCDDLSFIITTQKNLKPSKKNVSVPRMDDKNIIPRNFRWRISAETWDVISFKKGLL